MKGKTGKKEAKHAEIKIEMKYALLSVLAGLLYYAADYLKYPNSYSLVIMLIFLICLMKSFKKAEGIKPVIYLMVFSAVILPLTLFSASMPLAYHIALLLLNLSLFMLIIYGLRKFRTWGFYLAVLTIAFSLFNLLYSVIAIISQYFTPTLSMAIFILRNAVTCILFALMLVYLFRFKGHFKAKARK